MLLYENARHNLHPAVLPSNWLFGSVGLYYKSTFYSPYACVHTAQLMWEMPRKNSSMSVDGAVSRNIKFVLYIVK